MSNAILPVYAPSPVVFERGEGVGAGVDDRDAVTELYLRCLSRTPTERETATCIEPPWIFMVFLTPRKHNSFSV